MSGQSAPDPPAESGGLIVMVRQDPALAARALAEDLHAELAIGGEATERALLRLRARNDEAADLTSLTLAMRRAEEVRDRTRAAAAERLAQRLNVTLAIHPDTILRAAAALVSAEADLAAAVRRDGRSRRRSRTLRLGATGLTGAGVALVAVGLPPVGLAVAAGGLVGRGASLVRRRRSGTDPLTAHFQACALARYRWEQVAGPRADPAEAPAVVCRYDPQNQVVADLVGQNPAVRAADRVALERRLAWVSRWRAEVGDDAPLTDPSLRELLGRDETQLWLGEAKQPDEPDTLVVAAPYADLSDDRARDLHRRLLALPRGQRVIVVLAPEPASADDGRRSDHGDEHGCGTAVGSPVDARA